jgi:hypothetical protein
MLGETLTIDNFDARTVFSVQVSTYTMDFGTPTQVACLILAPALPQVIVFPLGAIVALAVGLYVKASRRRRA